MKSQTRRSPPSLHTKQNSSAMSSTVCLPLLPIASPSYSYPPTRGGGSPTPSHPPPPGVVKKKTLLQSSPPQPPAENLSSRTPRRPAYGDAAAWHGTGRGGFGGWGGGAAAAGTRVRWDRNGMRGRICRQQEETHASGAAAAWAMSRGGRLHSRPPREPDYQKRYLASRRVVFFVRCCSVPCLFNLSPLNFAKSVQQRESKSCLSWAHIGLTWRQRIHCDVTDSLARYCLL